MTENAINAISDDAWSVHSTNGGAALIVHAAGTIVIDDQCPTDLLEAALNQVTATSGSVIARLTTAAPLPAIDRLGGVLDARDGRLYSAFFPELNLAWTRCVHPRLFEGTLSGAEIEHTVDALGVLLEKSPERLLLSTAPALVEDIPRCLERYREALIYLYHQRQRRMRSDGDRATAMPTLPKALTDTPLTQGFEPYISAFCQRVSAPPEDDLTHTPRDALAGMGRYFDPETSEDRETIIEFRFSGQPPQALAVGPYTAKPVTAPADLILSMSFETWCSIIDRETTLAAALRIGTVALAGDLERLWRTFRAFDMPGLHRP